MVRQLIGEGAKVDEVKGGIDELRVFMKLNDALAGFLNRGMLARASFTVAREAKVGHTLIGAASMSLKNSD